MRDSWLSHILRVLLLTRQGAVPASATKPRSFGLHRCSQPRLAWTNIALVVVFTTKMQPEKVTQASHPYGTLRLSGPRTQAAATLWTQFNGWFSHI